MDILSKERAFVTTVFSDQVPFNNTCPQPNIDILWMKFSSGRPMEISARNQIRGTIRILKKGPVNTEVIIAIPGGAEIVSIITTHSAERMNLAEGKEVYAIMKASDVMVGKV